MKRTLAALVMIGSALHADYPWSANVLVSTPVAWDTLNQGESCFGVWRDSIYTVCNTAERASVPIAPYAYSFNAGQTFTQIPFTDNSTGIPWHTDPVLDVDDSGRVHMLIQYSTTLIKHYFSRDGGLTWSDTTQVSPASGVDKPWMVVNRNEIYICWQQVSGTTGIWLARSNDYGATFASGRVWNRTGISALAMDENQNLHLGLVDWGGGYVYYRKSTDKGISWSAEVQLSDFYYNTGYGDRAPINSITARGNCVFLTWVDDRDGDWDIMAVRSTNGGASWSARFKVNDDLPAGGQCKGYSQFDVHGDLHVIYYHTPDWPTSSVSLFSLRYRRSTDGGATFQPSIRVSDTEAASHADFIGEYHIARVDSLRIYAVWADGRNPHDNDLYFSKALLSDLVVEDTPPARRLESAFVMPTIWFGKVSLILDEDERFRNLTIYDAAGRFVRKYDISASRLVINAGELPRGVLFIKAEGGQMPVVRKAVNLAGP